MKSQHLPWTLGCAFATYFVLGAHDGALGVLLPNMAATYGVDRATISLPYAGAAVGYVAACLGSPWLATRLKTPRFLLVGMGCFCLGVLAMGAQPLLAVLRVVPLAIGLGAGLLEMGWNARIARTQNATANLNALHACFGIGALTGPLLASVLLATDWSWQQVYLLLAFLGLLAGLASQGIPSETPTVDRAPPSLRFAWGERAVVAIALTIACFMGVEFALGDWTFSFLREAKHLDDVLAGSFSSLYWLGIAGGRLGLWLLGPIVASARLSNRTILAGCLMLAAIGIGLLGYAPVVGVTAIGLVLTGLGLGPILPTALALLAQNVPDRALLGAISLVACLGSLGKGVFPWLCGLSIDRFGLGILPPYALLLAIGMGASLWWQGYHHSEAESNRAAVR